MPAPHSPEERTRALHRARRTTWLVLLIGLALLIAGGAEVLTADGGPLVLGGAVALLLGLATCVVAERRLSRIAYALKPSRMRRTWGSGGVRTHDNNDAVHWAAVAWFGSHGEGSGGGGGGGFWDGFGGGDFGGGGGGDGGGGGGG
jgi:hypothetical protein